jgi:hypothetical protein
MLESGTMTRTIGSLLLALSTLLAIPAVGQSPSKPNLSGTWVFNAQKSKLQQDPPSSITFVIDQSDPQVKFARTQIYGDQKFDWTLDIVADGEKEVVQTSPLYTANIRARWEGNSLILDQKITASDGTTATDVVTYSLIDGGNALEAVENQKTQGMKKPTTSRWVYEKKAQ